MKVFFTVILALVCALGAVFQVSADIYRPGVDIIADIYRPGVTLIADMSQSAIEPLVVA